MDISSIARSFMEGVGFPHDDDHDQSDVLRHNGNSSRKSPNNNLSLLTDSEPKVSSSPVPKVPKTERSASWSPSRKNNVAESLRRFSVIPATSCSSEDEVENYEVEPRKLLEMSRALYEEEDEETVQHQTSFLRCVRFNKVTKEELSRPAGFISSRSSDIVEGDLKCQSALSASEKGDVRTFDVEETLASGCGGLGTCGFVPQIECCGSVESVEAKIEPSANREPPTQESSNSVLSVPRAMSCGRKSDQYEEKKQHFRWFGHGKLWTCIALAFAWVGCIFAIISRLSTNFVNLKHGFEVSPLYEPVTSVGMIRMVLCSNETMTGDHLGCQIIRLSPEEINDNMFEVSRALLTLATALGVLLATVLSTSVYWETINLRPVGFGFLLTYFFQSFSMLFFDTKLCNDYTCTMGTGGILCILASFCWIGTCIACAKMDSFKVRAARARRKAARKKAKQERREARKRKIELARKQSSATTGTESGSSQASDDVSDSEQAIEELDSMRPGSSQAIDANDSKQVLRVLGIAKTREQKSSQKGQSSQRSDDVNTVDIEQGLRELDIAKTRRGRSSFISKGTESSKASDNNTADVEQGLRELDIAKRPNAAMQKMHVRSRNS